MLQKASVQVSVTDTYDESEFLREFDQVSFSENLISYDASEFLREFNHLQSTNVDILARALEISSIPFALHLCYDYVALIILIK